MKTIARLAALSLLGVCVVPVAVAMADGVAPEAGTPQPGEGPLANYTILKSTEYGKSMSRDFPANATSREVVQATVPDLLAYFGEKPKLVDVYRDQKDKKSGCVFFSETLNGKAVKGLSVIKVSDDATREWIVFCLADAPKGEAGKLVSRPQPATQPAGAAAASNGPTTNPGAAPAAVTLKTYHFPDGTGSVGVPEGWSCESKTIGNCVVNGPADQSVGLDLSAIVDVPNGQSLRMLQMAHGNLAAALIAPYNPDPATALKNLIEAGNRIQKTKGGPITTVDEVVDQKPLPVNPALPMAHTAIIEFKTTRTNKGVAKKFHAVSKFSVYSFNGGQDSWCYYATQLNAPEETFKQDYPVMNAILISLRENAAAIQAKGAAEQKQAEQINAQTVQMLAASDANIARMQAREREYEKSFADVDEGIRGYRKVYDTKTGEESDINLGDVNGVVNALNEAEPGRYVQIPLRDEVGR